MKYIRTKDGRIAEVKDNMIVEQSDVLRLVYKDKPHICVISGDDEIIKQADTIEELCDEFVYNNELLVPMYISPKESLVESWRNRLDDEFNYKNHKGIYGAIWTDKGLIYVSKINNKGELELLP